MDLTTEHTEEKQGNELQKISKKTGRFAKTSLIKTQGVDAGTTPELEIQPPPHRFAREMGRLGEPSPGLIHPIFDDWNLSDAKL